MGETSDLWTLGWLADTIGGELCGPPDLVIRRPVSASTSDPHGIAFAESDDYVRQAVKAGVGALIVDRSLVVDSMPAIRVDSPRVEFGKLLAMAARPLPIARGIHATAIVDVDCEIDPSASIGAYSVIKRGVRIGARAKIYAFAYVGESCTIGVDSTLYPRVTLYRDVEIGDRSIVHSGAVLGADGFGFVWDGHKHMKVPQVGGVRIGSDVEIGAITAIDRATAGETEIGCGTKLDNLVQIAHNVRVGADCVVAGQSGVAGSTVLGDRVSIGGQAAIKDHLTVVGDTSFGGRSGVMEDVLEPGAYFGLPARPWIDAMRSLAIVAKLPDLLARVRRLEKASKASRQD